MAKEHKVLKYNLEGKIKAIEETLDKYSNEGWELVSIIPITSGKHGFDRQYSESSGGWGYGYTSWLMITFSRESAK